MSLVTPDKIRRLQRTLYVTAKQSPARRFHVLYDKVWQDDILAHAYALSRANGGAPGVDGETFADIEAAGRERWLGELREEVRTGRYKPQPVRRVLIPKASGVGQRPLGIPTIRDRVVQAAAVLILEPIFEADVDEAAYGYRPKRSALDAVRRVSRAIDEGHDIRNPFRGIKRGKDKPRTRVLTLDEETLLLEALHPRFQRFVRFALGTGCRLDEIRGIVPERDIDWLRGTVHVIGKFRKERDVPMQPDARAENLRQLVDVAAGLEPARAEGVAQHVRSDGRNLGPRRPFRQDLT